VDDTVRESRQHAIELKGNQHVSCLAWCADGSLLAVGTQASSSSQFCILDAGAGYMQLNEVLLSAQGGPVHVYLASLPVVAAVWERRLAVVTSMREATVYNLAEGLHDLTSTVIASLPIEPKVMAMASTCLAVGISNKVCRWPLSIATLKIAHVFAHTCGPHSIAMSNMIVWLFQVWFYSLAKSAEATCELLGVREYPDRIESIAINDTHAATISTGATYFLSEAHRPMLLLTDFACPKKALHVNFHAMFRIVAPYLHENMNESAGRLGMHALQFGHETVSVASKHEMLVLPNTHLPLYVSTMAMTRHFLVGITHQLLMGHHKYVIVADFCNLCQQKGVTTGYSAL
jgi:hypothetical protein